MAEYYPLLAKAVAGLPNSTPETRRVVYERARKALLAQLQNLQPPIPEADLQRETKALDMAMARLEAELGGQNGAQTKAQPVVKIVPEPKVSAPAGESKRMAPRPPVRTNGSQPAVASDPAPEANEPEVENGHAEDFTPAEPPRLRAEGLRPEPMRPYAPQPRADDEDAPQSRRLWIVIAVVVLVVVAVAAAAWKLRERPEQLTAFNSATQTHPEKGAGKIAERVGGAAPDQDKQAAPAASPATPAPAPAPAAPAAAPAQGQAAAPAQKAPDTGAPIAFRAALLVEAPEEPNKVKTYVGTVIWKLQNVTTDPGQPPGTAVHADISVPDDKLAASMDIQKNTDPSLSASHTITIVFTVAPDSPTGSIKQISLPQLRNEDSPNGEPLVGSLVPIMDNSFLIGLNRGAAESANINLIKQREWFDIPILLGSGKVAKLTFEKNTSGDRAIDDALASWQGQQ